MRLALTRLGPLAVGGPCKEGMRNSKPNLVRLARLGYTGRIPNAHCPEQFPHVEARHPGSSQPISGMSQHFVSKKLGGSRKSLVRTLEKLWVLFVHHEKKKRDEIKPMKYNPELNQTHSCKACLLRWDRRQRPAWIAAWKMVDGWLRARRQGKPGRCWTVPAGEWECRLPTEQLIPHIGTIRPWIPSGFPFLRPFN